jgi:histidyl-tRNA synthetase
MKVTIAPGVYDILPDEPGEPWRSSYIWSYLEGTIREIATNYGFKEIRTPIFERTELLQRAVGETSDIVSKEMYTFQDKGGRLLSLRPEGTAPAMRAFIEHQMHTTAGVQKLFYISPMFRYERNQAGRYRQHHQFGVEAVGIDSPEQDAEVIDLLFTLYRSLGLNHLQLQLNSLGDTACRLAFRQALQDYLREHYDELSADSKARFELNPLRILDSKEAQDRALVANAPCLLDFLNEECRSHFERLQELLNTLNIPFQVNPQLVRGLDYYNRTVFEITAGELGAQNSIAGGGRYDGLLKSLGGPDLPACGFGTGLERIIQTMLKQQVAMPAAPRPEVYLIPLGEGARSACFAILHSLRSKGVAAEMDYSNRKLAKVMQVANGLRARYVAVVGEDELASGEVAMKKMESGELIKAPLNQLDTVLQR